MPSVSSLTFPNLTHRPTMVAAITVPCRRQSFVYQPLFPANIATSAAARSPSCQPSITVSWSWQILAFNSGAIVGNMTHSDVMGGTDAAGWFCYDVMVVMSSLWMCPKCRTGDKPTNIYCPGNGLFCYATSYINHTCIFFINSDSLYTFNQDMRNVVYSLAQMNWMFRAII